MSTLRAVIFDLGGVVFPSPLDTFRAYEQLNGLPHRFLSEIVLVDPAEGAWSRLERGELNVTEFAAAFEAECRAAGREIDAGALMTTVAGNLAPRPAMVAAIATIRARGLKVGALTNNWSDDRTPRGSHAELFDTVVESALEGLRKPDPSIYLLACERLAVAPPEVVFLDDLGTNLKPARALGMITIKVGDPDAALAELADVLGFPLHGDDGAG